jgi:hypothetical protein
MKSLIQLHIEKWGEWEVWESWHTERRTEYCENLKDILLILLEVSLHSEVTAYSCTKLSNQYTDFTLESGAADVKSWHATNISFLHLSCNSSLITNTFWDLNIYTTKLYRTNVGILWRKIIPMISKLVVIMKWVKALVRYEKSTNVKP